MNKLDKKTPKTMKYSATITDEEYERIRPYIDCREMANPMEYEFVIYDPTDEFLTILILFNITFWKEE
jgi:hypothetical protein